MKKIRPSKLTLARETVAPLTDCQVAVHGGLASGDTGILCTLHCERTSAGC